MKTVTDKTELSQKNNLGSLLLSFLRKSIQQRTWKDQDGGKTISLNGGMVEDHSVGRSVSENTYRPKYVSPNKLKV